MVAQQVDQCPESRLIRPVGEADAAVMVDDRRHRHRREPAGIGNNAVGFRMDGQRPAAVFDPVDNRLNQRKVSRPAAFRNHVEPHAADAAVM